MARRRGRQLRTALGTTTVSNSENAVPTLNLVGAGRVAQTLASLWRAHNIFALQDVLTTSLPSAQAACGVIGAGQPVSEMQAMRNADVWMLAVPDALHRNRHRQQSAVAGGCSGGTTPRSTP